MLEDKYVATGDGKDGVGYNKNHFPHQKDNFIRNMHDGVFW